MSKAKKTLILISLIVVSISITGSNAPLPPSVKSELHDVKVLNIRKKKDARELWDIKNKLNNLKVIKIDLDRSKMASSQLKVLKKWVKGGGSLWIVKSETHPELLNSFGLYTEWHTSDNDYFWDEKMTGFRVTKHPILTGVERVKFLTHDKHVPYTGHCHYDWRTFSGGYSKVLLEFTSKSKPIAVFKKYGKGGIVAHPDIIISKYDGRRFSVNIREFLAGYSVPPSIATGKVLGKPKPKPDLKITNISCEASTADITDQISVLVEVKNVGDKVAINPKIQITVSETTWKTTLNDKIKPKNTQKIKTTREMRINYGKHKIKARIDSNDAINEKNEDNNEISKNIKIEKIKSEKVSPILLEATNISIKRGGVWRKQLNISKNTKGLNAKTDFINSWSSELSYASKFPDLDIILTSPSGKKHYSELVEVKQQSDSRTEGKERLTEGISVFDPEPGKWKLKVESNSSKKWNEKTFDLKAEKMDLDGANIQAKLHDPFFPLNKAQKGGDQKGKTLAYLSLKGAGQNKYELEIFPNLGVSVPSLDSEKYPGVKDRPVGMMIVGYEEDSFDRPDRKAIEDIFYSSNGEVKPTTSPSKSMQEKVAVAAVKDITGLVPGLGLLQSNTVQLGLKTLLGDFVEDTKPAENHHVPTAKALKTDNGFDHYVKNWSAQDFEADYGDSVTIPFGLKFDQKGEGKRTFVLYLKLIAAHDSLGETSKPKKGPKLFEESIELKVTVDEEGKVQNVKKLMG